MEHRRLYREAGDPVSGRSLSLVFIPILLYAAAFLFVRVEAQQSSKAVMLFIARPLDTLNKNLFALRDPERTKHIYQTMIPHVTTAFSGGARSYTSHSHKTRKWSLPSINHLGSGGNALNFQVLGTAPGGLIDIETFDLSWDYVPLKLSNPIDPPLSPTDTELDPYNPSYPGVVVKEVPQDASDPYRVPNADLYGDEQQVEKQRELAGKLEEQQKEGKHKLGENKKHENDNKPKTVTEFYVSYLFNGGDPIDYFANEQQNTEFLHNVYGGSLTGMNPFTITKVVDTTSTIFGDSTYLPHLQDWRLGKRLGRVERRRERIVADGGGGGDKQFLLAHSFSPPRSWFSSIAPTRRRLFPCRTYSLHQCW